MAITPERRAQIDALLQQRRTAQPTGMTPARRAEIDAMLAKRTAQPAQPAGPNGVLGVASGFGKTIADAPRQFAESGQTIGKALSNSALGKFFQRNVTNPLVGLLAPDQQKRLGQVVGGAQQIQEASTAPIQSLQRNTGAEKIGEAAANIGMLLAPGGIAKQGAAALAPKLPQLGRFAQPVARGITEGIAGAGITAGQTGDLGQAAKGGALDFALTAGLGALGKGVEAAGGALKPATVKATGEVTSIPSRLINSIIKPGKNAFSFGKNPGKVVADLGIVGNSEDELLQNIIQRRNSIGEQIGQTISSIGLRKNIPVATVFKPLDEAITTAKKLSRTNAPLISRLEALRGDLQDVIGGPQRRFLDAKQAFDLKREIGSMSKWTGQAFDNDINQARVGVYRNLRKAIEDAAPIGADGLTLRQLNEQWGNLTEAASALENRLATIQRTNMVSLPDIGAIGAGGIAGGPLGAISGYLVRNIAGSPAVKTRVAARLATILKGIEKADQDILKEFVPTIANDFARLQSEEQSKFIEALPSLAKLLRAGINPASIQSGQSE